jgi:hypothetical protein
MVTIDADAGKFRLLIDPIKDIIAFSDKPESIK